MDKKLFLFGIVVVFVVCSFSSSAAMVTDTLTLGSSKTYTVGNEVIQITLRYLDSDRTVFFLNGTSTKPMPIGLIEWMKTGSNFKNGDRTTSFVSITLSKIAFQDFAGGVHSAEFTLENRKVIIKSNRNGGTTITADGEAWKVGTSTKILEMGEAAAFGANRETLGQIVNFQFIDDTELPGLLKSGVVNNPKGDAPYDQRLYFEGNNTGYTWYTEDDSDTTADFFFIAAGSEIARYELEFTDTLNSAVYNTNNQITPSGTILKDFKNTLIEILGKNYIILKANKISTNQSSLNLSLFQYFLRDTLALGITKTYMYDNKIYAVTLNFLDNDSAKLSVNGETTKDLTEGVVQRLSGDLTLTISEINVVGTPQVKFYLGSAAIELADLNILDTASSKKLTVNDEEIDDAKVFLEGTTENSTYRLEKISINMTADDDFFIPADGKLSQNPEMAPPSKHSSRKHFKIRG